MGIFTGFISVCAWISIPFAIPFTLQSFAIFLTLGVLGGKYGLFTILTYVLLGLCGFPIFSGFKGGFSVLMDISGGYILGFILIGVIFWIFESILGRGKRSYIISCVIGMAVCYFSGAMWYMFIFLGNGKSISFYSALLICVVPFIIPDTIKIIFASLLKNKISKIIKLDKTD